MFVERRTRTIDGELHDLDEQASAKDGQHQRDPRGTSPHGRHDRGQRGERQEHRRSTELCHQDECGCPVGMRSAPICKIGHARLIEGQPASAEQSRDEDDRSQRGRKQEAENHVALNEVLRCESIRELWTRPWSHRIGGGAAARC